MPQKANFVVSATMAVLSLCEIHKGDWERQAEDSRVLRTLPSETKLICEACGMIEQNAHPFPTAKTLFGITFLPLKAS